MESGAIGGTGIAKGGGAIVMMDEVGAEAESAGPTMASFVSISVASAPSASVSTWSVSTWSVSTWSVVEDSSSPDVAAEEGVEDAADSELLQFPQNVASSSVRRARIYDVRSCCGLTVLC